MKTREVKKIKRRSRYEVFASGGGITGATYHRKLSKAIESKNLMKNEGGRGIIIYDIKKDKPCR